MRSISTKKKRPVFLKPLLITIVLIAAVAGVAYYGHAFIQWENANSDISALPRNTVDLLYIDTAVSSGTPISQVASTYTVELGNSAFPVPDDVIYAGDDISGYVMKLNLYAGTTLCWSMVCPAGTEELFNDTTREVDISFIDIQDSVMAGDYVDIRFDAYNAGTDMAMRSDIVLAKKKIVAVSDGVVTLRLNEEELLLLTAAAAEVKILNDTHGKAFPAATISTTKYVSAAQSAAQVTYSNDDAIAIMKKNPNLANNPSALYEALIGAAAENERAFAEAETPEESEVND